ncbi:hypothetical protein ACOSP7_014431 [Xanthoceras sorbifolium]
MSSIHDHDDQLKRSNDEDQDWLSAMQLVTGSVFLMVMRAVIELVLLDIMSKANPSQLFASHIASQLSIKNKEASSIIDRIFRLLSSHYILTSNIVTHEDGHVQRFYSLAPLYKYFVPNKDAVSLAPYLLVFQEKVSMDSWYHLREAVLDGGLPFVKAHGMQGFEYAAIDGRMKKLFNEIMYNQTGFWLNQVVDIGGGLGSNLIFIVSKYPHIKGTYFDFPNAVKDAPSCPGLEHVGGDMFAQIPIEQAIFMKISTIIQLKPKKKWTLHHWDDDPCLKILKNCYDALSEPGKVIVVESIVSELANMSLFTTIPGTKEKTKEEF